MGEPLHRLLAKDAALPVPGIYDGLSARLVELAGFEAAFLSGACLSFARFGRPDMGLVSAAEVAETVAVIRERTDLPLIVDMDTGFGNALNVRRTVTTFERAGASALQMEDQLMPKRCGHMQGKQVISSGEMVGKIHAALDARRSRDTLIFARTDALDVHGFDDAMERAERYLEAGADAIFIEAPKTAEQMRMIGAQFGHRTPLIHNLVEGGHSPVQTLEELQALHYRLALFPASLLHLFIPTAQNMLAELRHSGHLQAMRSQMIDLADVNGLLGADELLAASREYQYE
ncbi:isocitrate lyase/PEP mutase family protein [Microbulbifer hydrolyticus]|uniref:2-methylisocitrate lyase-like PEP mutase family enzyme n=1 Tax=Microbulbifer hydrolyticus TaxID=48074 RepID=A0A6P1TEY2_9GAMM|nr:isocitrate lyase/PEP mutase family protein [Microbulbifer hydrolyticus]MBB5210163.1 2-methylisocitrate lyase-like PEP mutase family enzyme [Microbulbifer hydrolyticus]QHQ39322.1 carboxyvinyl-carboxyphosphonate phosphorylmutase [Microbulbifer hydrolyticus]